MTAKERKNGLSTLKFFIRKHLQTSTVPKDVKEGHFVVIAAKNEEEQMRFVVDLCVLKHPEFLRLLELAEEEFGLQQKGALYIPSPPDELRRILQDKAWRSRFHD